jgi:branched-chain amino acid transport system substrate-binding protein
MRDQYRDARARIAPGRFRTLLTFRTLQAVWVTVVVSACQTVGGGPGAAGGRPAAPSGRDVVVVVPGPISRGDQGEASRLMDEANRSFQARRFFEALRTTEDLVTRFPASDVSGDALRLSAEAAFETGDLAAADEAAGRYADLLRPGDLRGAEMRLLQARTHPDEPAERLDRLLLIDSGAQVGVIREATPLVREAADSLDAAVLQAVVDGAVGRGPLTPVVEARLAVALLEADQREVAQMFAQQAIDDGAAGEDMEWAEGVLLGRLPEGRRRVTSFRIGVVLPFGGPPALADFSALILEGIEVAAATVLDEPFEVTLVTRDDEGDPTLTAQAVLDLEAEGVQGIVGMLQDDDLMLAGDVRAEGVALMSPTARSAARAGEGVYSLEGADTEAAASIAYYAVSRAFQRIAIVHPQTPEALTEVEAFERAAESLGMPIVGRFAYEAGATFFEPQIRAARDALRASELGALGLSKDDTLQVEVLAPTAIFMPVPPEDVEFLAPQVIHFGLDTLAIELLGTSGWTDAQTLQVVDDRLTTGVVATAVSRAGAGTVGDLRFREAYEEHFQRSLVGFTPAIGYDATLLLLEALRPGRISRDQVRDSFASLEEIEGATGVFTVVNGVVMRRTEVVRIENRTIIPLEIHSPGR